MVFSSILFLLYFAPVFFVVYYFLPYKLKNYWLIISSLLFYTWGAPNYVFILLFSCFSDYYLSLIAQKHHNKIAFIVAVIINVGLLVYFKYFNFFIENISAAFHLKIEYAKIILPIGISFLTFQKISYLVDVYRSKGTLQPTVLNYILFVILFPQLIAGPIVRFKEIHQQIKNRANNINNTSIFIGLKQFIIGLSKKVLIANTLGESVDALYALDIENINAFATFLGLLGYSFQIYFDFSGYSDMAIGLGKMMGFTFPDNFNFPYISKNITEFWRRWHITLSSWMKDYLYIPLGGNKKGNLRTYINLFVVFLISGFWHGASWNFVIWGMYHGSFLVLERLFLIEYTKKIPAFIKIPFTFIIVTFGWLLFRVNSMTEWVTYVNTFSNFSASTTNLSIIFPLKFYWMLFVAIFFSFIGVFYEKRLAHFINNQNTSKLSLSSNFLLMLLLFVLCLGELFASGFNPFIYFKF